MSGAGASRAAAARVVSAVVRDGQALDAALAARSDGLAPDDARFVKALSYETMRWHLRLSAIAARLLDRPLRRRDHLVESLILVGICQLEILRVAPHAAVAETVQGTRRLRQPRASGLVNAVLRRFQRERDEVLAAVDATDEGRFATPAWLIDRLRSDWPDDWRSVLDAGNAHPPMWLRVHRGRTSADAYRDRLRDAGIDAEPLAAAPAALRLARPMDVTALPGFADGDVSVQDAAAQLASVVLDAAPGQRVLDACAAPGGKTCDLLEAGIDGLHVTALDNSAARLDRLRDNLRRLGVEATVVTGDALDPSGWWDGTPYDRILVDAPCSATGVIRRHPDIKVLRRDADIATLAVRQRQMLDALWPLLAGRGRLVYATCSVLRDENDRVVDAFLCDHTDATAVPCGDASADWGRVSGAGRQILTGEAGMDGFYYACLERNDPHTA